MAQLIREEIQTSFQYWITSIREFLGFEHTPSPLLAYSAGYKAAEKKYQKQLDKLIGEVERLKKEPHTSLSYL